MENAKGHILGSKCLGRVDSGEDRDALKHRQI
jgi:hypothetical protein